MSIESAAKKGTATVTANSSGVETEARVTRPNVGMPAEWFSLYRRSPGIIFAGSIAVVFAVGYLLVAPMGRDLSAQLAHAALARQHWLALLDLRWYGGFDPVGYSVLSPAVMALLGVRLTTALAYVASVVLFAALLKRTAVTRPRLGAIAGAVCMAGNLVVTRTPFTLGLAVALGALLALASGRLHITAVLAVLAALCSPVAGLFLGVAGGALFLSGQRRGGITVATAGLVPTIVVGFVFGNGGYQTFGLKQALISFLVCLVVAGMCWRTPVVRWGALLSARMVAGAYLIPTPVGTTATRLPELFDAPIIVAVASVPLVAVIAAAAAVGLLLPPVSVTEVLERGDPALSANYYAPLLDQLRARGIAGPSEVVPTRRRGEAALVAPVGPLPLQEGGRDKSTLGPAPSSMTERSTLTRTENGSTTTPSRTWPSLTGRTTGQPQMKRPWCTVGCPTCSQCGQIPRGPSMP